MRKRYCFVGCVLLLLLGSVPVHCAQAQKEDNKVPSEKTKNQKNEAQVVYGYFIPKGGMKEEEYKELLRIFKQKEASDHKWLAAVEKMYRKQFHYLAGEKRQQAVDNIVGPIKNTVIEGRMSEIYNKAKELEKNEGGQWFAAWKSKVVKA